MRGRSGCQQQHQQVRQMASAQRKPQSQRDLVEAKERASTQLTMGEKGDVLSKSKTVGGGGGGGGRGWVCAQGWKDGVTILGGGQEETLYSAH